jgi:hypothetical protein
MWKKVALILTGILLLASLAIWGTSRDGRASRSYEYPSKPGTPAWQQLNSHAEMQRVTTIPDSILKRMDTNVLIDSVLSYPLLGDIYAYDGVQDGFDRVASGFNGLQELLHRPDVGRELLLRYKTIDPGAIDPSWTLIEKGDFEERIDFVEILLAQPPIMDTLTPKERRELIAEGLSKSAAKRNESEVFGHLGQERTALMVARAMPGKEDNIHLKDVEEERYFELFVGRGLPVDDALIDQIFAQADRYLSRKGEV